MQFGYESNLGLTDQIMGYGGGLNMHAAVKQVIRERAVAWLLQGSPMAAPSTCTTVELAWMSPPGGAVEYDLRQSSQTITASNFDGASRLDTGSPLPSGYAESYSVDVGACSGRQYFALRWRDSRNFWSNTTYTSSGTPCHYCENGAPVPERAGLFVVTAQPATSNVTLRCDVPRGARHVSLAIYDVTGRAIESPLLGPTTPGRLFWTWSPAAGRERSRSGVYFAHLRVDDIEISRSVILIQ